MKRFLCCFLLSALLAALLCGCGLFEDGETEELLPDESYYSGSYVLPTDSDGSLVLPQGDETVKTVLSYQGEIPLTDPVQYYSYQLPMIDLGGAQAMGCNQEIEARFLPLIQQSMDAVTTLGEPLLESLTYSTYTRDGILTLEIDRLDLDGSAAQAFYTVDEKTGEAVSVKALFEAAGIEGDPVQVLNQTVLELFTKRYGALEKADAAYTTALNRTQSELSGLSANWMHLTRDGQLIVALAIYSPTGGSSVEELTLP